MYKARHPNGGRVIQTHIAWMTTINKMLLPKSSRWCRELFQNCQTTRFLLWAFRGQHRTRENEKVAITWDPPPLKKKREIIIEVCLLIGYERLKWKEFATISRIDAGHVLEETRLWNVTLSWRWRCFLDVVVILITRHPETQQTRRPRRSFWRRQSNIGRIGCERFNVPEKLLGSVCRVETESGDLTVIGRRSHRVKRRSGRFVVAQIVDYVAPQRKSCSAFGQDQLNATLSTRFRSAEIEENHRNSGEFQLPIG